MAKPETIRIDAEGIAPAPVVMGEGPRNWEQIFRLPPFEMFVREENILNLDAYTPDELWTRYAAWHAGKGFWPNENPDGSLKR